MVWASARLTAGVLFGFLALALGGCGGLLDRDVFLLAQVPAASSEPDAWDPVSPIPVRASRQPVSGADASLAEPAPPTSSPDPGRTTSPASRPLPDTTSEGYVPGATAQVAPGDRGAPLGAMLPPGAAEVDPDPPVLDGASFALDDLYSAPPGLDLAPLIAFHPISDETLVRIMLGLGEWPTLVAQASTEWNDLDESAEYDPWEPFNETMFNFNLDLDRYVLKPVAEVWDKALPDELKQMIARGFDNFRSVSRIVNSLLQAKWSKAGTETSRFLINSTVGIVGLWDMARQEFGLERPDPEDFGQTLGVWGIDAGPYLVLPVLAPTTVRDIIGRVVDGFMNPVSYFTPFLGSIGLFLGDTINDRALNLELFQGFEETTLDFYTAVRNAYLSRRAHQIRD
ncbi:MAG TPA: MlaA family lipoprotein [Candidatus Binatia bacterium]|nr:MlaA family lipoprotein [Candidatus Binatia bacterium]